MSVVVIGKNSFIAQQLLQKEACKNWVFLTHSEALQNEAWVEKASSVINCAFAPQLYSETYQEELDIDKSLALMVKDKPDVQYIMLSSRLVYGAQENLVETNEASPNTPYGGSKKIIEDVVKNILPERVAILRCSNIFGFEPNRKSFFGQALDSLAQSKIIELNIAPHTKKDFIPISNFCDIVIEIVGQNITGVYNVGSGHSLDIEHISKWLIEGYGAGEVKANNQDVKGQFFMDVSKLKNAISYPEITPDVIKQACLEVGRKLKQI